MTDAIERVVQIEEICEQYVRNYVPNTDSEKSIGRVEGQIIGFESYTTKYGNHKVRVDVETDWAEVVSWTFHYSNFHDSWVATLCDEVDVAYSEFEDLAGEEIWMNVLEVDWDEDTVDSTMGIDDEWLTEY